jgi:hypothetical protein
LELLVLIDEMPVKYSIYPRSRVRCLTAKAWEDRPVVLRQLDQIGEKSCVTLRISTFLI